MLNTPDDFSFLEKLYAENYALVYKLVTRTLRQHAASTADAADITQDVFILAAKRIDVLRSHPKPVGWLLKTTQYVCRNHISAYRRHGEQLFGSLDLHRSSDDDITELDTRISIEQLLKAEDYALLKAYFVEKQPTEEICRKNGLTPNQLRVRMHRLKKYLSAYFILLVIFAGSRNI